MKNFFIFKNIVALVAFAFVAPLCAMQVDGDEQEKQDAERKSSVAAESSVVVATPRRSVNDFFKECLHSSNKDSGLHVPAVLVDIIHGYYREDQYRRDIRYIRDLVLCGSDDSCMITTGVMMDPYKDWRCYIPSELDFFADNPSYMLNFIGIWASDYVTGFSGPAHDKKRKIAMDKAAIDKAAPLVCKVLRAAVDVGGQIDGHAIVSLAKYFPHPDALNTALALGSPILEGRDISGKYVLAYDVVPKGHPYEEQAKELLGKRIVQDCLAMQQAVQVAGPTSSSVQ